MKTKLLSLFLVFASTSGIALATSPMVTLNVQNMTCAVCPIMVKKALEHVSGVQRVSVDFASKSATVQFDDKVTTADKLTEATKAAGYPSSVKGDNQ